ncbi:hypothetical protein, conserved [Babesia bigemina]|uniref:Uncharacterized protein n=1 Tax=Babesia bigemina TaxID=5866 RepID=A0A061DA69_BABBI|nr:hypothetical protein, conserved [Babesia bigemina]CDR97611.1 hypothetical protein, conserved [Babesia bigemina]|eukprot:XP_012769797.1 hypothetical protein, conserved [Babesia bigemina]
MAEKEVVISRLQSALLRLPKDDLIKLLRSTYQAMRIKHGIPYERPESNTHSSAAQRETAARGVKATAARSKRKHSVGKRKPSDTPSDKGHFAKVEQPTFRQIDILADDFKDLNLSYDSDAFDLAEPSADNQQHASSPTHGGTVDRASVQESTLDDREFAIQTLKDDARQIVPPLDLSGISASAKEAYKVTDFLPSPEVCATGSFSESKNNVLLDPYVKLKHVTCPEAHPVGEFATDNFSGHWLRDSPGYSMPDNSKMPHPRTVVRGNYTVTPRPGQWVRGYPLPQHVYDPPYLHLPQAFGTMPGGQVAYRDMQRLGPCAPSQVRGRSVQRF